MVRFVLLLILFIVIARVFWRVVDNVIEAAGGEPRGRRGQAPVKGVQMARDPVCGTFVVRERAVSLVDNGTRVFFCSEACRDEYRPSIHGSGARSDDGDPIKGRTA